jgi:hypothetical protein
VAFSRGLRKGAKMAVYLLGFLQISPSIGVTAGFKLVEVRPTIKTTRVRDTRREEKRRLRKT